MECSHMWLNKKIGEDRKGLIRRVIFSEYFREFPLIWGFGEFSLFHVANFSLFLISLDLIITKQSILIV